MPKIVVDGVLAGSCEVARTRTERRRGLLGRTELSGTFLLAPCRSVHTFGMRFPIDVAHLRRDAPSEVDSLLRFRVMRTRSMAPNRAGTLVLGSCAVLEAHAGWFVDHNVEGGTLIEIAL